MPADAQLTLFTTSLSRIIIRQFQALACLAFVKLLLIVPSMWHSIKSYLFSVTKTALYVLSMQLQTVGRLWCTILVSMEVVLVTIYLFHSKNIAAYTQARILKGKCACINITYRYLWHLRRIVRIHIFRRSLYCTFLHEYFTVF